MAKTIIGLNDAKAVKRYSGLLAVDVAKKGYWSRKFMGVGETANAPVHQLNELTNDAGEMITYDLSMQLTMQPIEGDATLEGNEEDLKFFSDSVYIDQMRGGVNTGGKMTRKRTLHNLRDVARKRQSDWWQRVFDELLFMYASGARGTNTDFVFPTTYAGFANNALSAPDADHLIIGGGAKNAMDNADKMTLNFIDVAKTNAEMMGGGIQGTPQIQPVKINGEDHYVCVMNPWQEYDLRTSATSGQWLDIQKAAATAEGKNSPIFKGGLGMHNNVVLHSHKNCIRFSDYGNPATVTACRALFLGDQALVMAFGSPGTGLRFDWHEETQDRGNQVVISTSSIFGINKTTFNGKDYGVIAIDTYAAAPSV